jgi:hypothetical protein
MPPPAWLGISSGTRNASTLAATGPGASGGKCVGLPLAEEC